MLEFLKSAFRGGLKQNTYSTRLSPSEYYLLVNGRTRRDVVEGIVGPAQDTSIPTGLLQGCYAAGSSVILFIDGFAYIRDYSEAMSVFQQIPTFDQMDDEVEFIYAELVPASTAGFSRVPVSADKLSGVKLSDPINRSPVALVCQDGINQPRLIFPDGTARTSLSYADWTQENREYIPIGKQMVYVDGILYLASPDGLELFRSISGRPIDFMVNIDATGNKLATELDGGASTVSHKVSYNPITGLSKASLGDKSVVLVGTLYSTHLAVPITEFTLFGEPLFATIDLFPTGQVNQFSIGDIIGDTAFIDFNGIRSFNAINQAKFEGKNLPFSAEINPLLAGIIQNTCAVAEFDNYTIFGLTTIYGTALIWYDTINQTYVSVDIYPEITRKIKQFCSIKLTTGRRLFCITDDNKFFEILSSDNAVSGSLVVGEWTGLSAIEPKTCELKPEELRVTINRAEEAGNLSATLFVDGRSCGTIRKPVAQTWTPGSTVIPYGQTNQDTVENITFNFRDISKSGWKFSVMISWDFKGEITDIYANAIEIKPRNSVEQQAKELAVFMSTN